MRERIKDGVDWVGQEIRGEDHTLGYVLTFAVGVGVGLGVGMLVAPASGEESRMATATKVRRASEKAKPSFLQRTILRLLGRGHNEMA